MIVKHRGKKLGGRGYATGFYYEVGTRAFIADEPNCYQVKKETVVPLCCVEGGVEYYVGDKKDGKTANLISVWELDWNEEP